MHKQANGSKEFAEALEKHHAATARLHAALKNKRENPETPIAVPTLTTIEAARQVLAEHPCDCEVCQALRTAIGL